MNQTLIERERAIWNAEAERQLQAADRPLPITDYESWIASKRHYKVFDQFLRDNPHKHRPALQLGAGDIFFLLLPDIGYRTFCIGDLADRALDLARCGPLQLATRRTTVSASSMHTSCHTRRGVDSAS